MFSKKKDLNKNIRMLLTKDKNLHALHNPPAVTLEQIGFDIDTYQNYVMFSTLSFD